MKYEILLSENHAGRGEGEYRMILDEPEKLTLKQLFTQLPVGKLWALFVIGAGLITGTFSFGYRLSSTINEAEIARLEIDYGRTISELRWEIKDLNDDIRKYKDIADHERLNSLYLSYILTRKKYIENPDSDTIVNADKSLEILDEYMYELWKENKIENRNEIREEIMSAGL